MNRNIVCIGAGYIGGPTMAVIAKMNPDRKVMVVDINAERIAAWNSEDYGLPIYEPGLVDVVKEVRGKNLFFSTDIQRAVQECDIVFVGVNTPTKMFGKGSGRSSDLQYWEATARSIKEYAKGSKIVVEKSTLPVRTAAAMEAILNAGNGGRVEHVECVKGGASEIGSELDGGGSTNGKRFTVLSNPEFLAEGTAIKDLLEPDRVLIGGPQTEFGEKAIQTVVDIYAAWVPRERILTTNVWSAELTKLAANAFLAQRISSINAIAGLCEATGADVDEVARVIGADRRIGPKFLKAGPGFGGSCFKKDVLNLVYLCETFGLHTAAEYWMGVIRMNEHQQERIVARLFNAMFNTLANKKIALFGFAFKADTGDTRETPAGTVARLLAEEHVRITVTDPKALENAKMDLAEFKDVVYEMDEYKAAVGADAVVLMTDWKHYPTLDWQRIYDSMRKPALVFDTRNCLDATGLRRIGFKVLNVGK